MSSISNGSMQRGHCSTKEMKVRSSGEFGSAGTLTSGASSPEVIRL